MPPILRTLTDTPYADQVDRLTAAAHEVRSRAYARYSNFYVGAAVLTADWRIHVGLNVECVDYDVTHAEEGAFVTMLVNSAEMPVVIVAVGGMKEDRMIPRVVPPCGKCRQKIYEWIIDKPDADIDVIVTDPVDGQLKLCSIRELLPLSFG